DQDLPSFPTRRSSDLVLDGQVALDADVALELAGDADVAGTLDLALDGEVGGDQRFLAGGLARGRGGLGRGVGGGRLAERRGLVGVRGRFLPGRGFRVDDRHVCCPLREVCNGSGSPGTIEPSTLARGSCRDRRQADAERKWRKRL